MLNLTVRNVGQGDCIVLRWKNDDDQDVLGIIDCNEHNMESLLAEISEVKIIKFILLTHPHSDHYSGLFELLKYCFNPAHSITVDYIYHSATLTPEFLIGAINYPRDRKLFSELLKRFNEIHHSPDNVTKCKGVGAGVVIELNSVLKIKCLAPDYDEIQEYTSTLFEKSEDYVRFKHKTNNPRGNFLSTVLLITTPKWDILLTSDAMRTTFERLMKSDKPTLKNEVNIVLSQVPHHGSFQNHAPQFWIPRISPSHYTFISSGIHKGYKHPHCEVVKFFHQNSKLEFTNYIEGFDECEPEKLQSDTSIDLDILDFISEPVLKPRLRYAGDIPFNIDKDGNVYRSTPRNM